MRLFGPGRFDSFVAVAMVPVALLSLVIIGLLGTVIALSLTPMPNSGLSGPTLQNYVEVFTDSRTYEILLNSLLFGLTSLAVGNVS